MKAFSYMPVVTQKFYGREFLQDMVSDGPELFLWWTSISLLWVFLQKNAKCKLTIPTTCHLLWEPLLTEKQTKPQIPPKTHPQLKAKKKSFLKKTNLLCKRWFCFKQWWRSYGFPTQKNSSVPSSIFTTYLPTNLCWNPIFTSEFLCSG